MTQKELLYSVCMYVVIFFLPPVPSALFSCLFVEVGSCPSVLFFQNPGAGEEGEERKRSLSCLC